MLGTEDCRGLCLAGGASKSESHFLGPVIGISVWGPLCSKGLASWNLAQSNFSKGLKQHGILCSKFEPSSLLEARIMISCKDHLAMLTNNHC